MNGVILQIGMVAKVGHWNERKDKILNGMRSSIIKAAQRRDLTVENNEEIEIIHMTQDPDGTWRSAKEENATHVKVTLTQEALR